MSFEEKFDYLVEKHESLTRTLELLALAHGSATEKRPVREREDESLQ